MATLLKEINVGYATGNWYLRLYEDSISQSIDGNYTTVNLRLTLRADRSTWVSFDNRDAWIHGTHFTPAYRHDNPEHNIGTTSIRINHNADGTGSYSVGFGISTSYALNGSSTGGRTLPTIPRASGFTSVSGGTLGQPITLEISRASSSFTHTVRYQFGSIVREYTNQSTSCSFTPPLSDASQIPNAMSGICTMTLYTYNGGTLIGTKSMTISIRIDPTQCAPSFTNISVTRVDNGVPAGWGVYVQGKSKATISIEGATAKYGASIVSYQISVEGFNGGNGLTAGPFRSGTISIKASVVDSRNISTNQITQIVVYENAPPALSIKAERCNSAGTPSNNGTYIKVTPTYSCASVNGKNYISSKVFKINGTSYQNTTGASGASFILGNNDIEVSKAYVVSGIVTDTLGQSSATIEVNIPTSSVPIHVRDNQDGISFGKYSETTNTLESDWQLYLRKGMMNVQNNVTSTITNENSSFTHYTTNASLGHYFNKDVRVNGNLYGGGNYNQRLAYLSELQEHANNKVLWTGALYMNASQTAVLSQSISSQSHGIVLVFSKYYSAPIDQDWAIHFIPKHAMIFGQGQGFLFANNLAKNQTFFNKYLYISDTRIYGDDANQAGGTGAGSLPFANHYSCLRYVIGV